MYLQILNDIVFFFIEALKVEKGGVKWIEKIN